MDDDNKIIMRKQYLERGLSVFFYAITGSLLLIIFDAQKGSNIANLALWFVGLFAVLSLRHYTFHRALHDKDNTNHSVNLATLLDLVTWVWWLSYPMYFGLYETSIFWVLWRICILFIVLVFFLDVMQYNLFSLFGSTFVLALGCVIYLYGFTNIGDQYANQLATAVIFGGLILLMFGKQSYGLNIKMADTVVQNKQLLIEKDEMLSRDALTSLYNRSYFDSQLGHFLKMNRQTDQMFCVVMMDIDFFKTVNDTHGHHIGDVTLIELSKIIKAHLRETDILARYGGEEFVALLLTSDLKSGYRVMDKLREKIAKHTFKILNIEIKLSVSVGITSVQAEDSLESILIRADEQLYKAKEQGRNLVITS